MAKRAIKVETPIEEVMPAPVVEEKTFKVIADKLNLRKEASIESEVVMILDKDAKLIAKNSKSVKGFYPVVTPNGVEGYVMKDFIVEE